MTAVNKAYAVLNLAAANGAAPFGAVQASYVVLAPDGTQASHNGTQVFGSFTYGDSNEAIRQAVVGAIRTQEDDSTIDVNFISG